MKLVLACYWEGQFTDGHFLMAGVCMLVGRDVQRQMMGSRGLQEAYLLTGGAVFTLMSCLARGVPTLVSKWLLPAPVST